MVQGVSLTRNGEVNDMLKLLKGEREFIKSKVVRNAPADASRAKNLFKKLAVSRHVDMAKWRSAVVDIGTKRQRRYAATSTEIGTWICADHREVKVEAYF